MTNGIEDFKARAKRAERLINGKVKLDSDQTSILLVGLILDLAGEFGELKEFIADYPALKTKVSVLETRVFLGIGLTVAVGIAAGLFMLAGGG